VLGSDNKDGSGTLSQERQNRLEKAKDSSRLWIKQAPEVLILTPK
jgi:hypothetical protein